MDYLSEIVGNLGVGPTIIGAAVIVLLFYSIFGSKKGGGSGSGKSGSSSGNSTPTQ